MRDVHEVVTFSVQKEARPLITSELLTMVEALSADPLKGTGFAAELTRRDPEREPLEDIKDAALNDKATGLWKAVYPFNGEDRADRATKDDDLALGDTDSLRDGRYVTEHRA